MIDTLLLLLLLLFFQNLLWVSIFGYNKLNSNQRQITAQTKPTKCKNNRDELTWDEKQYACSKGFVKPVEGGVMDEGHNTNDDADETGQKREDHESAGGI